MHTFYTVLPHVTNALSFCLNELPLFEKYAILFQKEGDFTKI